MEQRNDDMLFNVTQQAGNGVQGLLDSVFGFLQRRTDFFYEMEPGDNMGFPPGVAESMVTNISNSPDKYLINFDTFVGLLIFQETLGCTL